jgi:hypothetical protein
LKADGRNWAALAIAEAATFHRAYFNLSNGTIGNVGAGVTAAIEPAANGFYKCSITRVLTTINPSSFAIELASANGTNTYLGNGTSGVFVWGGQIEVGAYATSYSPTSSASVTRNIDVVQKTGVSSLIGQTEGTIYWEGTLTSGQTDDIFFLNRNLTNSVFLYKTTANQIFLRIYYNSASIAFGSASGYTVNVKIAASYIS